MKSKRSMKFDFFSSQVFSDSGIFYVFTALKILFLFKPNTLPLLRILQWKAKFSAHHSNTGLCYTVLCWLHMEPSLTGAGFEHRKKYGLFQIFLSSINSWKSKIIFINQNLKHKEPSLSLSLFFSRDKNKLLSLRSKETKIASLSR